MIYNKIIRTSFGTDTVSMSVNPVIQINVCRGEEILETKKISTPEEMWVYVFRKGRPFERFGKDVVVNVVRKFGDIYKQFVFKERKH